MRAEIEAPFLRFRPRRGGNHRQPGEAARELDQDRADAAGAAGDQQRARIDALAGHRAEPVEQQFPGGDRGEGKGGGLRERQRFRLAADDALVDQMEFRIGALAQDRAGVKHFVARLEQRDVGADGIDDAGGVIAQDLGFALRRGGALADLVVDRVGRDRLHGDADVAALRLGLGGLEIDQRVRVLDRKRFLVSDGLHGCVSCLAEATAALTVASAPIWQVLSNWGHSPCLDTIGKAAERPRARQPGRRSCRTPRRQNANCVRIATASNFEPASPKLVGADLLGDVAMQIVEHEADVAVDVPVQRQPCRRSAVRRRCRWRSPSWSLRSIVLNAAGDFPGAPAAAVERERMRRLDAAIGGAAPDCTCGFRRSARSPPAHSRPGISGSARRSAAGRYSRCDRH